MTSEERAFLNAEGQKRGSMPCPECGDSAAWKPFHRITYFTGTVELRHRDAPPNARVAATDGSKGIIVACEDCWPKLSVERKTELVEAQLQRQTASIKPVIRNLRSGQIQEDPDDLKRYERQTAAIEAEHRDIRQAVLAGA